MVEIEWALEFFDPDYLTMDHPHGKLRHQIVRSQRDAEHAALHKIPQGKEDYRVVRREVQPWQPVDLQPAIVSFIGNDGHRHDKGTGAIPNEG